VNFANPNQYPFEFVGIRSSPTTYMEKKNINEKFKTTWVLDFYPGKVGHSWKYYVRVSFACPNNMV
jgi:hypothetical protein